MNEMFNAQLTALRQAGPPSMHGQPKISIFLSSPADVASEREAAERVVQRLNGVYAAHVELAAERWERHFYEADRGFQEAIAPMDAFDIVIGILWKRLGSELPPDRFSRPGGTPYESGTVYEIETALQASRRSGRPSIYVFKSERQVTYAAECVDDERAQKEALDGWWERIFRDEAGRHIAATNSFGDTEDFEVKFENCLVDWLKKKAYIPTGPVWDVKTKGSPYPGLVAYEPKYSPVFFGRHLAVEHACEELLGAAAREGGRPVLFVIGASGSGKSSLVRAGLVPRITQPGVVSGVDLWRTAIMVPTADSLVPLAEHLYAPEGLPELAASAQRDPERWARMASGDPEAAADSLAWALDRIGEAERLRAHADRRIEARLLLVIDQLEGLFGTPGQKAFIKVLRALVDGGRVWLLATLRSDRYTELQFDRDLLALKREGATYDLQLPGEAEIADVVKGPARTAGLSFAERDGISLARVLVEAAPKADALPLLQMTLAQLFERREGTELTFAAYEAMSEVEGAIAAYADTVFARVPPAAQRELDPLVRALVRDVARSRSDDQVRFTARNADRKAFETSDARKQLVEVLVDGRLLVSDVEKPLVSDDGKLRVAHEALLRRWERARHSLRKLDDAELRKARLQRALATAAAVVFLVLAGVAVWQTQVAEKARESAQRNEQRSFDALARIFAERAWQAMGRSDYPLAARYAVAGARTSPANAGAFRSVLGRLLHDAGESRFVVSHKGPVTSVAFSKDGTRVLSVGEDGTARLWDPASGQMLLVLNEPEEEPGTLEKLSRSMSRGAILQAAFSPDDAFIATVMSDASVHIVEVASGREALVLSGHESEIARIAFSPDGTRIVVADRTSAHIWNAQDGRKISILRGHQYLKKDDPNQKRIEDPRFPAQKQADEWVARMFMDALIQDAAFSPDSARVVTASQDGTARIWDAKSGREIAVLRDGGLVYSAAFTPDGSRVFTTSGRGTRIWDAKSGREITILGGREHYYNVISASMSRDGTRILTTERRDNSARIWDAESGREIAVLRGHKGELQAAAFSMSGGRVVTASSDRTVRIWNTTNGEEITRLRGHSGAVRSVAFSPDGQSVASASEDGSLRIWKAQGRAIEHIALLEDDPVISETFETFSRDGERILSTFNFRDERGIGVWSFETPNPVLTIRGHTDAVMEVAFSPDGTRIASASLDDTVRVWDAASGHEIAVLHGHERAAESIRFSPDGKRLVRAGGSDGTARIWDAATGHQIAILQHPKYQSVRSAAFSSDGARIVTTTSRAVRVWDTATGRETTALEFEEERTRDAEKQLTDANFSPDGTRVVALMLDGTAQIWDLEHRREIAIMRSSDAKLYTAAFSPDGTRVATAARDGMVHIWDAESGREIAALPSGEYAVDEAVFSPDGVRLYVAATRSAWVWDVTRLTQSLPELVASACTSFLPPSGSSFSAAEIGGDPLIREVLRDDAEGDVCEGVRE